MKCKLLVLGLIAGVTFAAHGVDNFAINPYFELDSTGEVNLTEREFDCLGWAYWCDVPEPGEGTWVVPCDDRPPARMMAVIGNWEQCAIWQQEYVDYYLEPNTGYIFEVDLKNIGGCEQVQVVIEDETYRYETNKVFDITDQWDTYSIFLNTTEYPNFVGLRVGGSLRVFDADGGRFAATNLSYRAASTEEVLKDLIQDVIDSNLKVGLENKLLAKLGIALQKLTDASANNDVLAIDSLEDFICIVDAQPGNVIFKEDAEALIVAAQQIIDMINGG